MEAALLMTYAAGEIKPPEHRMSLECRSLPAHASPSPPPSRAARARAAVAALPRCCGWLSPRYRGCRRASTLSAGCGEPARPCRWPLHQRLPRANSPSVDLPESCHDHAHRFAPGPCAQAAHRRIAASRGTRRCGCASPRLPGSAIEPRSGAALSVSALRRCRRQVNEALIDRLTSREAGTPG